MYSLSKLTLIPIFLFFFAAFISIQHSHAQSKEITITGNDMDVSFTERLDHTHVLRAITTREGSVDLMLTETDLLIQFSDEGLERINKQINKNPDDSHFAAVIKSMVSSGVQTLLDRAMKVPLYEISEISYSEGNLIIRNREGQKIFEDLDIEGNYEMKDFSRDDALQFVADAERLLD